MAAVKSGRATACSARIGTTRRMRRTAHARDAAIRRGAPGTQLGERGGHRSGGRRGDRDGACRRGVVGWRRRGGRAGASRTSRGASSTSKPRRRTSDVVSEVIDETIPPDLRLVVGRTPGVTSEDHVAEAGRKVMRFHLARMLAREAGTRAGHDPEELHAMRVATRRQRAAWRVFGASFRPGRTKRYRTRPARDRVAARRRPRPGRPARGGRPLSGGPAGQPSSERSSRSCRTGAGIATTPGSC